MCKKRALTNAVDRIDQKPYQPTFVKQYCLLVDNHQNAWTNNTYKKQALWEFVKWNTRKEAQKTHATRYEQKT